MGRRIWNVALICLVLVAAVPAGAGEKNRPKTGFEESNGEEWTTHKQELDFLAAVDRLSDRATVDVIGRTPQKRPMHLVQLGHPRPRGGQRARKEPTILFTCSQHGNEPAGREACLRLLRDLAFTSNPRLVRLLSTSTILFIPTANPDGRAANTRENSQGVDTNRDHLNLETPEAQIMAEVVGRWRPDATLDLHEYGPSIPAIYDDEILYLWPRNLNIDDKVHDLAKALAEDYIVPAAEEAGYTADEYGQYAVGPQNVYQSAGDEDEGIARNAMGLRHSIGLLIESAVSQDPRNGPQEITSEAEVRLRRVESQFVVSLGALDFMAERGAEAVRATDAAFAKAIKQGRSRSEPVYFGGADNDPPEEEEVQDPPPCGYELSAKELDNVRGVLRLLGISWDPKGRGAYVPMGQYAEPLIPLLLDERGARHSVSGKPIMKC
jgi:hypothetical protein